MDALVHQCSAIGSPFSTPRCLSIVVFIPVPEHVNGTMGQLRAASRDVAAGAEQVSSGATTLSQGSTEQAAEVDLGEVTALGEYKGLEVTRMSTEVPDEELEARIQSILDANPEYVAADLLSQAEHDELASAILVTTSEKLAKEVAQEATKSSSAKLSRSEIIRKSLDNYGYILVADTMGGSNRYGQ